MRLCGRHDGDRARASEIMIQAFTDILRDVDVAHGQNDQSSYQRVLCGGQVARLFHH